MFSSETLTHGTPYCRDPQALEYDSMLGPQREGVIYDWYMRRWRKVKYQPLRTSADRVAPADVDAQMGAENLGDENDTLSVAYQDSIAANRVRRADRLRSLVLPYLQEHGPTELRALLQVAQIRHRQTLSTFLDSEPETFVRFLDSPQVWGLHGQSYKATRDLGRNFGVSMMRDALTEHGPLLSAEMAQITGLNRHWIDKMFKRYRDDVFVVVRQVAMPGCKTTKVYGLVGVHEEE